MRTTVVKSLLAIPILILLIAPARADSGVKDPVGDFLPTYTGPHGADLDVVRTRVSLIGTHFIFSAKLNGNIGTTNGAFYVWGVNRGAGFINFASLGLPNIVYDAIVVIFPDGTGRVRLFSPAPPVETALPPGSITISGNTFRAVVPASFLPSQGFAFADYGQNLWPRCGCIQPFGNPQIADFAPDDRNAPLNKVEETVRWDIVHVLPPNVSAGGMASALANDNSKITLTGSGTFEIEDRKFEDVTGGGTWETFDKFGTSTGSGTYEATRVVRLIEAPGAFPPLNDLIGNAANASPGLLVVGITYSDGTKGILVVSCHLVGTPDSVFEGITTSKGFVDYWNRQRPNGPTETFVDANRTLFHITSEHEDED